MIHNSKIQSPDFAKMSQATAEEGCSANCAYCGLARKRPGTYQDKSFIHVPWPVFSMDEIIKAINKPPAHVKRTCISMITNGKCRAATLKMTKRLKEETTIPISILISPTILNKKDLVEMRACGADKIGVAIDLASRELFEKYRGKGVSGPHKWEKYWEIVEAALEVFEHPNVGAHLMVGMGETEEQMVSLMDRLWRMGVLNHLFSFFAEEESELSHVSQPPWATYLRVQLARYLIEEGLCSHKDMGFDGDGHIVDFGTDVKSLSSWSLTKP